MVASNSIMSIQNFINILLEFLEMKHSGRQTDRIRNVSICVYFVQRKHKNYKDLSLCKKLVVVADLDNKFDIK